MTRIKKLALAGAYAIAIASGLIAAASPAAYAAQYTVTASPSSNLTNNEIVNVTGAGFPANDPNIVVAECGSAVTTEGLADCVTGNAVQTSTNAQGEVSTPMRICVPMAPGYCMPVNCNEFPYGCGGWTITVLDSTEQTSVQGSVAVTFASGSG